MLLQGGSTVLGGSTGCDDASRVGAVVCCLRAVVRCARDGGCSWHEHCTESGGREMMAMSKGESDGEFLKADWRLMHR
ncbi:hypothetical protein TcYC6_0003870 [Trypanosoma cruzi]|nr:hypothetical protein TcYC6_0003870 [Trypanosoma cruzi]